MDDNDYKEVMDSHKKLVREIDVILNGEEGAAKQASLCDLVGQIRQQSKELAQLKEEVKGLKDKQSAAVKLNKALTKASLDYADKVIELETELQQLRAEREGLLNWVDEHLEIADEIMTQDEKGLLIEIKSKLTDSFPLGNKSAENLQNSQNIPEREETKLTDAAKEG